jgi:Biotin-protein ligase, N terminal
MPAKARAMRPPRPAAGAPILLFNRTGTSANDIAPVETILNNNNLSYWTANSLQMNGMSESQLRGYRLLIIPGGNFIDIGRSLNSSTAANIHNAVQHGFNYLGICAGAFLAGNSSHYNGLNLTSGVKFGFLLRRRKGYPQGCGGDCCRWGAHARALLGGRAAVYRVGCGCR